MPLCQWFQRPSYPQATKGKENGGANSRLNERGMESIQNILGSWVTQVQIQYT